MFVSMNLQIKTYYDILNSSKNVNHDMLEYDVYNSKHNYYMTERFELCALTQNKYIFNHINPFHKINHIAMHWLKTKETEEELFIVQIVNIENGTWEKLNNKRLKLHQYLRG